MTASPSQFDKAAEVLGKLGVRIRRERLGGSGGGLCVIREESVFFLDLDADPQTQLDSCIEALASIPEAASVYMPPVIRESIDRLRANPD
ncbi:MAG: hypothetical protein IID36_10075 [Planctomycetes bacterium]|nr:hypothetical protein [Planctomycetota bacterium]